MGTLSSIKSHLKVPARVKKVATGLVGYLMTSDARRTLRGAAESAELSSSAVSRFLAQHKALALKNLNRLGLRALKKNLRCRRKLDPHAPWTVAVIIDATLHERSSLRSDNVQRFNHGQGWIVGHQWTNIVLLVNGQRIPLAPLPFLTRKKCQELGVAYLTEPERIMEAMNDINWDSLLPGVKPEEIVVLCDSGYDNKRLQNFFVSKGWDFTISLKKNRTIRTETQGAQSVEALFRKTRKIGPNQTTLPKKRSGKNRRSVVTRTLTGYLDRLKTQVTVVRGEKPNKGHIYIACSRSSIPAAGITSVYRLRWEIELFHREMKSYLGFEDAGLVLFEAIHSYVLWVYTTYFVIGELTSKFKNLGILGRKQILQKRIKTDEINFFLKLNSRYDSREAINKRCYQVKSRLEAA